MIIIPSSLFLSLTVLLQFTFDPLTFFFPSGAHLRAITQWFSFSLLFAFGQEIVKILLMQLIRNVSSLLSFSVFRVYRVNIKQESPVTLVDISTVRADFLHGIFTQLLNNEIFTFSPRFVEIHLMFQPRQSPFFSVWASCRTGWKRIVFIKKNEWLQTPQIWTR